MVPDKYTERRFDTSDISTIDVDVLQRIPFEYPGSATDVTYETTEFSAVCPWTGLPDFARLRIIYRPGQHLVELKSLKYYLTSYRNVGILQENAIGKVLRDLVGLLEPISMHLEAWYNERGGISTYVAAHHPQEG
jgi:7-cyano-7-deazaguanine reductase